MFVRLLLMCLFLYPVLGKAQITSSEVQIPFQAEVGEGQERHLIQSTLHGTLLRPDKVKRPPVVLLISGSGPTDRNGNNPQMENNSLKILAESLADAGIASLRYDKRGIAASSFDGFSEGDMRFDQLVDDAAAWVRWLREQKKLGKVLVAGHSEGALIGTLASQRESVVGFISLCGAGFPAGELLKQQLSIQPMLSKFAIPYVDSLTKGVQVDSIMPLLYTVFRPSVQPYLISWFAYDPAVELAKLEIPVLIVDGGTDIQVGPDNALRMKQRVPTAQHVHIPTMNHILKDAPPERMENMATYSNPELPLTAELMPNIISFIRTQIPR